MREYTRTNILSFLLQIFMVGYSEGELWCDYGDCGEMTAVDAHLR